MHITIFTSLRHYVRTAFPSVPREVLDGSGGDGSPDERFRRQLKDVARAASVTEQQLLHGFGEFASSNTFKNMCRDYYTECSGTTDFLLNVEDRIHETVRRSIPGAAPPRSRSRATAPTASRSSTRRAGGCASSSPASCKASPHSTASR